MQFDRFLGLGFNHTVFNFQFQALDLMLIIILTWKRKLDKAKKLRICCYYRTKSRFWVVLDLVFWFWFWFQGSMIRLKDANGCKGLF